MNDLYVRLAELEMLNGWLQPAQAVERQEIYDKIAGSEGDEINQAYEVFRIVAREAIGTTASVADQRLAQLEILKGADTYAALGGISVSEIVDHQGWWAPNWAWMQTLTEFQPPSPVAGDLGNSAELAPLLLRAGAQHLAGFYDRICEGAGRLLRFRGRLILPRSNDRAAVALTMEVLQERRRLFLSGPSEDGHYLHPQTVADECISAALVGVQNLGERPNTFAFHRRHVVAE